MILAILAAAVATAAGTADVAPWQIARPYRATRPAWVFPKRR